MATMKAILGISATKFHSDAGLAGPLSIGISLGGTPLSAVRSVQTTINRKNTATDAYCKYALARWIIYLKLGKSCGPPGRSWPSSGTLTFCRVPCHRAGSGCTNHKMAMAVDHRNQLLPSSWCGRPSFLRTPQRSL